jgi:hypothetical protein
MAKSLVVNVSRNRVEEGQQQDADDEDEAGALASPDPDRVVMAEFPVNRSTGISRCV